MGERGGRVNGVVGSLERKEVGGEEDFLGVEEEGPYEKERRGRFRKRSRSVTREGSM